MNLNDAKRTTIDHLMKQIGPHLSPSDVTEVAIVQPGELWQRRFSGWQRVEAPALTIKFLNSLSTALAVYNDQIPVPLQYVLMPDGERATIAKPPALLDGTYGVAFRKRSVTVKTIEQLDQEHAFAETVDVSLNRPTEAEIDALLLATDLSRIDTREAELLSLKLKGNYVDFLRKCVQYKRNIVITGKTGSGKTTLARTLIELVPSSERIITVEDVHELVLPNHANKLHMIFGDKPGQVTATECLHACMRLSPDRIFLAELRGNETWDYVNSLNTGHPGAITTVHANNARHTFERIAMLIKVTPVGQGLDIETVRNTLNQTIDVVVFMDQRKVLEIFYDPVFSRGTTVQRRTV